MKTLQSRAGSALLFALLAMLLVGCATPTQIKVAQEAKPVRVLPLEKKKPIMFSRVAMRIKRGEEIGTVFVGFFNSYKLYWQQGHLLEISSDDFNSRFREEFEDANYEVVGDPDALFDDDAASKAELLVAGLITDLKVNPHYPNRYDTNDCCAQAYMKVKWQIYSTLDRKVVMTLETEGTLEQTSLVKDGLYEAVGGAFSMAVRNLLAQQKFHDLVVSSGESRTEGRQVKLKFLPPVEGGNIVEKLPDLRMSVVTILNGEGDGSGFIVTDDGYMLTDCHVVGESRYVRIKFASGLEADAEVVCKNAVRDVALVKCGEQGLKALPVNRLLPKIGEEVYAIGTPGGLKEGYTQTVTKGIVSGFWLKDGQNYIQSDVAVNHGSSGGPLLDASGNVLGICDLRALEDTSHNSFTPIDEAIKTLKLDGEKNPPKEDSPKDAAKK